MSALFKSRRPAPRALAFAVVGVLSVVWSFAVDRPPRLPNPGDALPGGLQPGRIV
jgi:hypothetical protein